MSAKEWLNRAYGIEQAINALQHEQSKALARAVNANASGGGERTPKGSKNAAEEKFISYADYSAQIDERIDALYDTKQEIECVIAAIPDGELQALLTLRYLSFETWEQIAEHMHYSDKWVRTHLHSKALAAAEKIIF